MKMLQFAFFDNDSEYLPRTYKTANCVAYPGSHDADCVKTWCKNLTGPALLRFNKECPRNTQQSRGYDLIEFAMRSSANLAVVPMQDYLELTNDEGRMNTPAIAEGNWTWRMSPRYRTQALTKKIQDMTFRTKRATK
jgi:4-alpha-glucanotransferase